jgi:hypothetical protein
LRRPRRAAAAQQGVIGVQRRGGGSYPTSFDKPAFDGKFPAEAARFFLNKLRPGFSKGKMAREFVVNVGNFYETIF